MRSRNVNDSLPINSTIIELKHMTDAHWKMSQNNLLVNAWHYNKGREILTISQNFINRKFFKKFCWQSKRYSTMPYFIGKWRTHIMALFGWLSGGCCAVDQSKWSSLLFSFFLLSISEWNLLNENRIKKTVAKT